jgi:hypothetical protein
MVGVSIVLTSPIYHSKAQTGDAIVYENPLAYINDAGNVYITDVSGGVGTAITSDAYIENLPDLEAANSHQYVISRWSPDGKTLVYALATYEGFSLFSLESRQLSTPLLPEMSIDAIHTAWSPDGTQLAFFSHANRQAGLFVVTTTGGEPQWIASIYPCIGDAPGLEKAARFLARESGNSAFRETYFVAWVGQEILFTPSNECFAPALVQLNGTVTWGYEALYSFPALSPDGSRLTGLSFDFPGPVEIDVATGEIRELPLPANSIPLTWSADTLFYYTRTETTTLVDEETFLENSESTLTIWQSALDGSPDLKIYETRGYGIGKITVSTDPDLPLAVSVVIGLSPA